MVFLTNLLKGRQSFFRGLGLPVGKIRPLTCQFHFAVGFFDCWLIAHFSQTFGLIVLKEYHTAFVAR